MTPQEAINLSIKSLRAAHCDHDTRMKLIEAENVLLSLVKTEKEEKKGK